MSGSFKRARASASTLATVRALRSNNCVCSLSAASQTFIIAMSVFKSVEPQRKTNIWLLSSLAGWTMFTKAFAMFAASFLLTCPYVLLPGTRRERTPRIYKKTAERCQRTFPRQDESPDEGWCARSKTREKAAYRYALRYAYRACRIPERRERSVRESVPVRAQPGAVELGKSLRALEQAPDSPTASFSRFLAALPVHTSRSPRWLAWLFTENEVASASCSSSDSFCVSIFGLNTYTTLPLSSLPASSLCFSFKSLATRRCRRAAPSCAQGLPCHLPSPGNRWNSCQPQSNGRFLGALPIRPFASTL